jgi:hypothetical protein
MAATAVRRERGGFRLEVLMRALTPRKANQSFTIIGMQGRRNLAYGNVGLLLLIDLL